MTAETLNVPHPGEFIREELEARGWSQRDLAFILNVPEQTVHQILTGKRGISAEMAKRLGKAFDVAPEFFVNLQSAYDLSKSGDADPAIGRRARLQSVFPIREMIRRQWLSVSDPALLDDQVARFFEAPSIEHIACFAHAPKKSNANDPVTPIQMAWLYRVRHVARAQSAPKYSGPKLRRALDGLHHLMSAPEDAARVPGALHACGVRFVVVEALPGAKIDGVCTWLDDSPVVGMSLRLDRIDNFWFVLRHELEHVLEGHGRSNPTVDVNLAGDDPTGPSSSSEEKVANRAASAFCVPSQQLERFVAQNSKFISERALLAFASALQVHPGIAAGAIRHRLERWDLFTKHNAKTRHAVLSGAVVDGWGQVARVSI